MSILNEIETAISEKILLNEVSNETVIRNFITNDFPHNKEEAQDYNVKTDSWSPQWGSANLKITRVPLDLDQEEKGWSLNFNVIPMLFLDKEGGIYFNTQKYSTSTSKVQTIVRGYLETEPDLKEKVREVDGSTIIKLVKGESIDKDLLKKVGDEEPEPEENDEDLENTEEPESESEEKTFDQEDAERESE